LRGTGLPILISTANGIRGTNVVEVTLTARNSCCVMARTIGTIGNATLPLRRDRGNLPVKFIAFVSPGRVRYSTG
jgi:hypothetical protein